MGRLSAGGARVAALPSRLGGGVDPETGRSRDRDRPWRGWYKTGRWQRLRRKVLKRDGYTCQATGVLLTGVPPAPDSPVVDHIVPHRGDARLFWDAHNLRAVSKAWHDGVKQSLEKRGLA